MFKNSEKTFKQEVDKNCKDVKIVQVNFTKSGNLVIEFEGDQDYASFQDKFTKKFSNLKIHKISKKEQELQIVIKGLNYKTATWIIPHKLNFRNFAIHKKGRIYKYRGY